MKEDMEKLPKQNPDETDIDDEDAPAGPIEDIAERFIVRFDPLQRYLSELGKYKLLTREKEKELAIRVQEYGDNEAAYTLVTSNLRLVVKIALE